MPNFSIPLSGLTAESTALSAIANNLANQNTPGFRRRRLQFQDLLYQNLVMPGAAATQQTTLVAGLQIGLGTRAAASEVVQLQGDLSATGNPLDLAINGEGFFQVTLPSGETAYTRSGTFHLDAQGNVVTSEGDPITPAITIPTGPLRSRWGQMARSVLPSLVSKQLSKSELYSSPCSPILVD